MLEPELYCWVSVYMTINDLNLHYSCSIYYYSCVLLWPNLSHLAEHKVSLFSLFALSLFCLLGHCLSLLWVAPLCVFSDQGMVNVGLFNHPYELIHLPFTCPSIQKDFPPSCLTLHTWKHLKHTLLLHLSVWQAFLNLKRRFIDYFEREKQEKRCFLELLPSNIFDFMVLIIFLRNHSRIKHKDFPFSLTTMELPSQGNNKEFFFSPFCPLLFFNFTLFFFTTYLKKDTWGLKPVLCIYLDSVAHM